MTQVLEAAQTTSAAWRLKTPGLYTVDVHGLTAGETYVVEKETPAGWVACRGGAGPAVADATSESVVLRATSGAKYRVVVSAAGALAYVESDYGVQPELDT